ncbi:MAG: DUF4388 domain-containing protein [Thermoanaerobaculia bacterium]
MGLEGTLRVFSLTDIFQVLALQRKGGTLTVEGEDDTVTVSFLGGQVVSADSSARRLENRIGTLLVLAGRINEEQLNRVLQMQTESQERLGSLLIRERMVTREDLREALRLQVFRIIFSAFRWTDGRFRFSQEGPIDYDAGQMAPVPTELILMEAAQMLDEWPILQKKVRSREIVFRRAPGVENLRLVVTPDEVHEGTLAVSRPEAETWRWVDGNRTVADIMERALLSDFDVLKGFVDLVDRNLIEETFADSAPVVAAAVEAAAPRLDVGWVSWLGVVAVAGLGFLLVPRGPWNPLLSGVAELPAGAQLMKSASLNRLERLERGVRIFYDATGKYPLSLEELVSARIIPEESLRDPYGRSYRYILRPEHGKFGLYGRNARGEIDLDLSFDRTLAPVGDLPPASSARRPVEKKPGVQVIE